MVVKINREHLRIILMKNGKPSISSSMLKTNVCLICTVSVTVGKKCNLKRHFMTMHKDHIRKYPRHQRKDVETQLTSNVIYDRVKQYVLSLLANPKRRTLLRIKLQKSWL